MVLNELFSLVFSYVNTMVTTNLYIGVFLAMFIETVFPPIPSEMILPTAGYLVSLTSLGYIGLISIIILATLGTSVGAVLFYYLSLKLGRKFVEKYGKYFMIDDAKVSAAEKWFEKYGAKAVFFGRMAPGMRELVSVPAGFSKMEFGTKNI